MFESDAEEKGYKNYLFLMKMNMSVLAATNMRLSVSAVNRGNRGNRGNKVDGDDIGTRLKRKVDRMKGFQKKIADDRKKNVIDIAKDIDELVKSEISKTRSMIDEHIEFFQQEWDQDKEDCDIRNPLFVCEEDVVVEGEETKTTIVNEGEDYFE